MDHRPHPDSCDPSTPDEFDSLTDLFLDLPGSSPRPTGTDPSPKPTVSARRTPARGSTIEAIVLGHLPVRASIWVKEYALWVSKERDEPVGLIRRSAGGTTVEIVGAPTSGRQGSSNEPVGADAMAGIAQGVGRVSHWIVRVDETDEPLLTDAEGVGRVTLLTGADEAAVVASYRLMKSLTSGRSDDEIGREFGVAVMGAEESDARRAGEKLERAAKAFLSEPIRVAIGTRRLHPAPAVTLSHGASGGSVQDLLGVIRTGRDPRAGGASSGPGRPRLSPTPDAPVVVTPPVPGATSDGSSASPALRLAGADEQETPTPEVRVSRAVRPESEALPAAPGVPSTVRIGMTRPETSSSTGPSVRRRARVTPDNLPLGLRALETRCPLAPRIILATDEQGGLHLIGDDREERIMASLQAVVGWVRDHLPLLLRTEPDLAIPSSERDNNGIARLHMLTADPRRVRPLLDTEVRLHLRTEVDTGTRVVLVTTPLN